MSREQLIADCRREHPLWHEDELGPWADAKLRVSVNVANRDGTAAVDWPSALQRVECHVLLITGDPARGAIVTWENAADLGRQVPQTIVAPIAGAGHNIRRDRFDDYMEMVRSFLERAAGY
jgi:hypothetical protein